ncbi:MAG: hypothetical protein Q4B82_00005, partial [Alysiella sp.]|nr:hypothetical protein [Alysiella sp.]
MKTQIKLLTAALALAAASAHAGVVLNAHNDGTGAFKTLIGVGASGEGVAIGRDAQATGVGNNRFHALAVGNNANANRHGATALGNSAYSDGWDGTAVGTGSQVRGGTSTAIGIWATVLGDSVNSTALGSQAA